MYGEMRRREIDSGTAVVGFGVQYVEVEFLGGFEEQGEWKQSRSF